MKSKGQTRHKAIQAVSLVMTAMLLSGCRSLAREDLDLGQDRLAGIFITENYIPPGEPVLETDMYGNITFRESDPNKFYGSFQSQDGAFLPVSFPGLEGYGVYNLQVEEEETRQISRYSTCDDFFTDCHITVSEDEECMESSLYVPADLSMQYYFNPVYQQADGQIYLLPGSGISSTDGFTGGQKWSQSLAQSSSLTENGAEYSKTYRFTVNIISADSPADTELLFMDDSHRVRGQLTQAQLDALFLDERQLELPAETAYLILCQKQSSGEPDNRFLFNYGTETLEYMTAQEDAPLLTRRLQLIWP